MEFLSNRDVTEIIAALVTGNPLMHSDIATCLPEIAKACVKVDRILAGKDAADGRVDIRDRIFDGVSAVLDLIESREAINQIVRANLQTMRAD